MLSRRQFALGAAGALALASGPARSAMRGTSRRLEPLATQARAQGASGLVVLRGDETLLSVGAVDEVKRIASCRKSIINALFGIGIGEGSIRRDMTLGSLGIDDYSGLTEGEKQATVQNLLESRSGVYIPASAETPRMRELRPERGSHAPGTFWYYNNWDFNVLGEIYQRATGESLFSAIEHRLARPLGWQDFDPLRHVRWGYEPSSPRFGAYNMWMSTRDMARFGQLFLNRGHWGGRQLFPESWIAESTTVHSTTTYRGGTLGGYGYMWWIVTDRDGKDPMGLPLGAFTAAGHGGRYITVLPAQNLVVAMQPDEREGQPPVPFYAQPYSYSEWLKQLLDAVA